MFKTALLASALAGSALATDQEAATGKVKVEFQGSSGGMKLFPSDDDKAFIMIQQEKLAEVDGSGKTVKDMKMAGSDAAWTAVAEEDKGNGVVVYSSSFAKTENDGREFGLTAFLTRTTTTVTETVACDGCSAETTGSLFECKGADNVCSAADTEGKCAEGSTLCTATSTATADSLKFSIRVAGWQFADTANKLTYGVTLKSKGGGKEAKESDDGAKAKRVDVDGGYVEIPTVAYIHGGASETEVDVAVTTSVQGSASVISFEFPSFGDDEQLWYDPTMKTSDASGLWGPSIMAILSSAVVAFGMAQQ